MPASYPKQQYHDEKHLIMNTPHTTYELYLEGIYMYKLTTSWEYSYIGKLIDMHIQLIFDAYAYICYIVS